MNGSIGIFDSGFGGLDVCKAIVKELPEYKYLYLADSARAPYGPRSKEEVLIFTQQGVEFLFSQGARLVILACNTGSSDALRTLQQSLPTSRFAGRNILGVLVPAAEEAVRVTHTGIIGVIGTEQTIQSKSFEREIKKLLPSASIIAQACPRLVPLIEQGDISSNELMSALCEYLLPLVDKNIDTLVLGCTHYGLIEESIKKVVGENIKIVRESRAVPPKLVEYLKKHSGLASLLTHNSGITFYTTDTTPRFEKIGSTFWGEQITAHHVLLS